jgi:RimJ/RimL family protein N-acetyltransferase
MARPLPERRIEVCGLWLFARKGSAGLGADLLRRTITALSERGYRLVTGFIDAGNRPLVRLYRQLGFTISPTFKFLGLDAATIEIWSGPAGEIDHAAPSAA